MTMRLFTVAVLLIGTAFPVFGQPNGAANEEMMKIRQALTDKFAAAVAKKDVAAAVADLFTSDAILQSLCPESARAFGREAYLTRVETALKSGFRDYSGKVKEAHLLTEGLARTTGAYTFTVNDKDGKPEQARGNWIDMLRREGNEWKVSFQAYAKRPADLKPKNHDAPQVAPRWGVQQTRVQSMVPYAFLSLALWPLFCCGDECRVGLVCTSVSVLLAVIVFVIAQLVRELWLLRTLRGYQ